MSGKAKGIIAIIASAFGFALMALCVRMCDDFGGPVSSFQKSFFRNLIAFAISAIAFFRHRPASLLPKGSFKIPLLLVARATLGTVGIFANFYALCHIHIAEAQTLNKTAPFFTVLFAWVFIGERVTRRHLLPLMLAFAGIVLIAKPGFAGDAAFPLAMGLLGGVCAGGAYACVRGLRQHQVPPTFIVLFFSVFSCLASIPFMLAGFDPMTWRQVLILFGAGAGAAIGQFGVTLAYGFAAPRDIAVFDYTNVLFTAAFGFIFFSQIPDVWSALGFVAIIVAAIGI